MVLILIGFAVGVVSTLALAPQDGIHRRRMRHQREMYEKIICELKMDKAALLALLETRKKG